MKIAQTASTSTRANPIPKGWMQIPRNRSHKRCENKAITCHLWVGSANGVISVVVDQLHDAAVVLAQAFARFREVNPSVQIQDWRPTCNCCAGSLHFTHRLVNSDRDQ